MKKNLQGQATLWVVLFIGLSVVFAGLSVNSYMKIIDLKLEQESANTRKHKERTGVTGRNDLFCQIVNLTGFYSEDSGESAAQTIDAIATKLGIMYISQDLNLRLISSPQRLFRLNNVSRDTIQALENYTITEELRQLFEQKGKSLAPTAKINYESPDNSKWLLGGAEQSELYLLARESSSLAVSLLIDKEQLTNQDYVKRIEGLYEVWQACTRRITYQSDIQSEWGLQQQLVAKRRAMEQAKRSYEQEQGKTKSDIRDVLLNIQRLSNDILSDRAKYQQKLEDVQSQIREIQRQRLQAKQRVTRLLRQKFYQARYHQEILDGLQQRIQELEQEAAGESTIEERLDMALAEIDDFLTAEQSAEKAGEEGKKEIEVAGEESRQDSPDGEIVHVDQDAQTAYINLGRSHGVVKGLKFDVFRYGKGGKLQKKGTVVVRQIRASMSMAGVTAMVDPLDPIHSGDKIINRIYDSNKTRYFVVAGNLERYSLEEFSRMVERIGGKLETEITAKTEMIILANGFNDHPIFQRGMERGIEMMLESKFLGYIEGD